MTDTSPTQYELRDPHIHIEAGRSCLHSLMEHSMSNLQSAKSAIKAEIDHARKGLDYYQSRVEILEQALTQLEHPGVPERTSRTRRTKESTRVKATEANRPRRGRPPSRKVAGADELPYTGGDFWLGYISDEPHSAAEILKSAVNSIGVESDKAKIQKLRQRLTAALQAMLQAGKIKDSGAGRERRYVKSA
jgi:hypothetical protein